MFLISGNGFKWVQNMEFNPTCSKPFLKTYRYNLSEPEPERVHKFAKWPQKYFQTNSQTPAFSWGQKWFAPSHQLWGLWPQSKLSAPKHQLGLPVPPENIVCPQNPTPSLQLGAKFVFPQLPAEGICVPSKNCMLLCPQLGARNPRPAMPQRVTLLLNLIHIWYRSMIAGI